MGIPFRIYTRRMNIATAREKVMRKTMPIVLILILSVFIILPGTASAKEINRDYHQSFAVKQGDTLRLRHGDGDVRLIRWDEDAIDVKVRYRADVDAVGIRLGSKDDFVVEFRQTGDTVTVTGRETSRGTIGFYNKKRYEYIYEIHSPDYIRLDLDGDDGDVEIHDWSAEINCRIDDGDIKLQNIRGNRTTIRAEDGDIDIDGLTGDLTIRLDDGDIRLDASDMPRCLIEGNDGDIDINESKGSFDITVDDGNVSMKRIAAAGLLMRAEDGNIDLELLAEGTLDADIRTDDGDVHIGLERGFSLSFLASADDADYIRVQLQDIANYREDENYKSGSIGGGNGRLKIQTADGDITIRDIS